MLEVLYEVGNYYGEGIISNYSNKLTNDLSKEYGISNLKNMRQFYLIFRNRQALPGELTWSHCIELLRLSNVNEINYYIDVVIRQNLSYRKLNEKIKIREYERLDDKTKEKLIKKEDTVIGDFIKNPIIIKSNLGYEEVSEKVLKQLILEDIDNFLMELGEGFCYIKNEYPIKLGDKYNYLDMLLYNIKFNCYVVLELKITELKAEHIGQLKKYMNYIDKNVKSINQDKTIGIIIVRKDNKYVMEYCSDDRIYRTIYNLEEDIGV